MKKLIKAFAIVSVLFLFVIIKVGAESGDGYCIREDGDCYKLYIIQDGKEATVMSCERLAPLFDRVNEIGQGIINIDGLEINEGVELYGSLRVKGRAVISSGGVISISGGDVIFDGADIVISGGYIRVKNGTLTALNGRISSEDTAILIDHAAGARARIVGCELNCSSEEPMIVNKVGTVEVYSGKLSNNRGAVIENDASLFLRGNAVLCGYGADVSTNSPIYLSDGKGAFAGDLRIRYGRPISDGTLTPLFYNADPLSLKGVTVFDINGNGYIPEYFESYKDVEER